ncbi:beta-lactamase family protein [Caballeronia sp. SEWSISQ10-4 2]|uniref:serine hydrolase domain-containing protein n=1 Tax=Caballeronia sp. SEWSISQ10-4 2 TaxID=2937438 RepID=UPI0026530099|nr:serine hydrolase [Caballeronia sp. SEWSISQ10-4 2]MDN7180320.1 beta-lactamase family protein [Caballeronia sp. SEWSISQ10-4 2]
MTKIVSRRDFFKLTGAAMIATQMLPFAEAASWATRPTVGSGFAPDLDARFEAFRTTTSLRNLHSVVVLQEGNIAFERYFVGLDETRGQPAGEVVFGPDTQHDLRSVTKSLVSLLYGIALADKRVPPTDQLLMAQFPEYPDLARDPQRAGLTIANVLTMTLGMQWNERLSYRDPANSETAMDAAPDRYRYVLERPIVAAPGEVWIYNGGAVALIGRLIEKGTGQPLADYARSALFEPLGIDKFAWAKGTDGEAIAASGLRLTPRELARIGQMVLARGQWEGRTIVPAAWLEASFRPAATVRDGQSYGYLWRVGEIAYPSKTGIRGERYVMGLGNGGQLLAIVPARALVVVVTAGNYNDPKDWQVPDEVLRHFVLPSLKA